MLTPKSAMGTATQSNLPPMSSFDEADGPVEQSAQRLASVGRSGDSGRPGLKGLVVKIGDRRLHLKLVPRPTAAGMARMFGEPPLARPAAGNLPGARLLPGDTRSPELQSTSSVVQPDADVFENGRRGKTAATGSAHFRDLNVCKNMCRFCGREFVSKSMLQRHEKVHIGDMMYKCQICGKKFTLGHSYNLHLKLHATGRRFYCSSCRRWFKTNQEKDEHESTCQLNKLRNGLAQRTGSTGDVDMGQPRQFGVTATAAQGSGAALLSHKCDFCVRTFRFRRDKLIHERTHTGERPYTCGYCGSAFTQSQSLTIHIRSHTGDRPYQCKICARSFVASSALRKHMLNKHTTAAAVTDDVVDAHTAVLETDPLELQRDSTNVILGSAAWSTMAQAPLNNLASTGAPNFEPAGPSECTANAASSVVCDQVLINVVDEHDPVATDFDSHI